MCVRHAEGRGRNIDTRGEEEVVDQRDTTKIDGRHRHARNEHLRVLAVAQRLDERQILGVLLAIGSKQTLGVRVLGRPNHVALAVCKVLAPQRAHAPRLRIVPIRLTELDVEVQAFVVLLQDDVDGTGDGVGTVNGRATDRNRFHALDELRRNHVQVHLTTRRHCAAGGGRIARDEAATIDEGQRALRAEAVQVDVALRNAVGRLHVRRVRRWHTEARHFGQGSAHIRVATLIERDARDHGGRLQSIQVRARNARTRHHHFFKDVFLVLLGFLLRDGERARDGQRQKAGGQKGARQTARAGKMRSGHRSTSGCGVGSTGPLFSGATKVKHGGHTVENNFFALRKVSCTNATNVLDNPSTLRRTC